MAESNGHHHQQQNGAVRGSSIHRMSASSLVGVPPANRNDGGENGVYFGLRLASSHEQDSAPAPATTSTDHDDTAAAPDPSSSGATGAAEGEESTPRTPAENHHNHNHRHHAIHTQLSSSYEADNPTPHRLVEGENAAPLETSGHTATDKLVIIMVGLPACGKTHIAKRICRYLQFFLDIPSQIFNVGDYRRQLCGAQMPASFYDPQNVEAVAQRTMACNAALADMVDYLREDGVRVAVYDATNSTKQRRRHLIETLEAEGIGAKKIFLESICDNDELLEENIRTVKLGTPDYRDADPEDAVRDFRKRRANYESVYETLDEKYDRSFIKIYDCKKFVIHEIRGYLSLKVVHFVMNLHTLPRTFYLTRHGQSEYNLLGKIGGDSGLTKSGVEYARRLAVFAKETVSLATERDRETGEEVETVVPARLWTSTLRRTNETAQFIDHPSIHHIWDNGDELDWIQLRPMARRNLDELYAGICDGMTYKEIEEIYPEEFERRQSDKLAYRYPRGESYMDVILRLEPLAHDMERTREPILVVGHQGILRILYAYFMGLSREEAPYVTIPLNTIIQLTPHAYGCHEKRTCLMHKDEMINDGQDEPVTSMPLRNGESDHGGSTRYDEVDDNGQHHGAGYHHNDPVMNAPSC